MTFNKAFIISHFINVKQSTRVWLVYDRNVKLCTMEDIYSSLEVDLIDINKMRDGWITEVTLYLVHDQRNKDIFNKIKDQRS